MKCSRGVLRSWRGAIVALLVALSAACSTVLQDIDPPRVFVDSVRNLPAGEVGPRFQVVLRIANPNARALDIVGISYGMELLGRELVSGVSNEVPRIEGYAEERVVINAGVNLIELLRLLGQLGQGPGGDLAYRFHAKIDFRGLLPTQYVSEEGSLALE